MTIQEFQAKMQSKEDRGKLLETMREMTREDQAIRLLDDGARFLNPWF